MDAAGFLLAQHPPRRARRQRPAALDVHPRAVRQPRKNGGQDRGQGSLPRTVDRGRRRRSVGCRGADSRAHRPAAPPPPRRRARPRSRAAPARCRGPSRPSRRALHRARRPRIPVRRCRRRGRGKQAAQILTEPVEQCLAHAVGRRSQCFERGKAHEAAAPRAADDPHPVCVRRSAQRAPSHCGAALVLVSGAPTTTVASASGLTCFANARLTSSTVTRWTFLGKSSR